MNQDYLIFGLIALLAIGWYVWNKSKNKSEREKVEERKPVSRTMPAHKVENDKLVMIEDAGEEDVKKILKDFCALYNIENCQAIMRLVKVSEKKFAVTFPYDMEFEIFCFFVNYANYPSDFKTRFHAKAWTTKKHTDTWITAAGNNEKIMLYVLDDDTEYDNVFITTIDNVGYKLGFAMGEEKQLLNKPELDYIKPPVALSELEKLESIEFK